MMIQYLIILSITDSVVVFDRFIAQVSLSFVLSTSYR